MIAGSLSYRAHEEREMGFLHLFKESFPEIEVIGLREGHDKEELPTNQDSTCAPSRPRRHLQHWWRRRRHRAGSERGRPPRRPDFVGHGLSPDTRAMLIDGTMDVVITQNQQSSLMDCVTIFSNLRAGRRPEDGTTRSRTEIVLKKNLP
jgi:LacI family transcriptional regulator